MRSMNRRVFLAAAAGIATIPKAARANPFPKRPVRLVVPSGPGGGPDIACRLLAQALAPDYALVVDNKPGAAGIIATMDVVSARPDGYTLGYANIGTLVINRGLFATLPYDPETQLTPVATLGASHNLLVARESLGVRSLRELIERAKAAPESLVWGSAGIGTTSHLGAVMFMERSGARMLHVPMAGTAQALQELAAGRIDVLLDNSYAVAPHLAQGKVRALAISSLARSRLMPDLPTISEAAIPGYEISAWGGIVAPASTPLAIRQSINTAINRGLSDPGMSRKLDKLGIEPQIGGVGALFDLARADRPKWSNAIRSAKIQPS